MTLLGFLSTLHDTTCHPGRGRRSAKGGPSFILFVKPLTRADAEGRMLRSIPGPVRGRGALSEQSAQVHGPECVSGRLILLTRANERSRAKRLLVHDPFCLVRTNCLLGRCGVANTRRLHVLAALPALIDLECFPHRPSVPPFIISLTRPNG